MPSRFSRVFCSLSESQLRPGRARSTSPTVVAIAGDIARGREHGVHMGSALKQPAEARTGHMSRSFELTGLSVPRATGMPCSSTRAPGAMPEPRPKVGERVVKAEEEVR